MNNLMKEIKDSWFILIFVGSLVVSWTMFDARLTNAEEAILKREAVFNEISSIKIDIAVIREQIVNINSKI